MEQIGKYRCQKVISEIEPGLFESKYYCCTPDGLPFIEGNRFIEWVNTHTTAEKTALNYIKDIFMLFSYFRSLPKPVSYLSPPDEIRKAVKKYIETELGWHVKPHRGGNYVIERREVNKQTGEVLAKILPKTLQNRIHSWKEYYRFLIEVEKCYEFNNPFSWKVKKDDFSNTFIPTMPPISGMSLTQKRQHWETNTYFCVVENNWEPYFIDDPELPSKLYSVLHHFDQVYRCILHALFESGGRKHEILSTTIGDFRDKNPNTIGVESINKGSANEKTKHLHWSVSTERMIRNYINHERMKYDCFHRSINELGAHEPLFINRKGKRITPGGFYRQFRNICTKAEIAITVHQIRHWFVTTNLQKINEMVDKSKREEYRQRFIRYMGWKNRDTIKVYDHYLGEISNDELTDIFDREYKPNPTTYRQRQGDLKLTPEKIAKAIEFKKFLNQEFDDEFA